MQQPDQARRLLLIDGHSVAYRAFYALPTENFSTSTGQHTNAVYGFLAMLINVLRDEQPTHVAVAFDVSRQTFRTEAFEDYKATRAATPQEFRGQVELIKELLDGLNIAHVEQAGYEADDVIATLARRAAEQRYQVLICTGDRDSLQLVDDQTTVLYPRKGVSDLLRLDPALVEERYLVPPQRYPELAALVGETSDNLPGVPGVGPKTAAKWLAEYDGLDNLLLRADQVRGKVGDSFRAHLDDVRRNRQLNRLVDDLDLPVTVADLERVEWDREQVHQLLDELEFRVLRDRLIEMLPADDDQAEQGFEVQGRRLAPGEVSVWLSEHGRGELTGLDVQGRWGSGIGDVAALGLAGQDGEACWVDVTELTPEDDQALAAWLADEQFAKVMHDAKGPLLAIWSRGWDLRGLRSDTQLAAYLLRPDQRTFDLGDLSIRYLHRDLRADEGKATEDDQLALDFGEETGSDEAITGSMVRARAVIDLAQTLDEELDQQHTGRLLSEVELPLQRVLAGMERLGIAMDIDLLHQLRADFDTRVITAEQSAFEVVGRSLNLGSPKQLQVVLFDELNMPKTRRTKSGYTTDASALENLFAQTEHPFLAHLLDHRDAIRLRQTVDGLLKSVGDDGRIHTTYLQTIAATGRLSSTDPNLQNIPIRTDEGRRIRAAFVVGEGYECLLTADYSQIEMRVMADVSGDQGVIDAFLSGADFHTITASKVFGVQPDQITGVQRAKVKQMNYGLAYGLSAFGLSNQLKISVAEARELMDDYYAVFGGVRDYLQGVVAEASKTGYTETLLGRRRYLPELNSTNRQRREMAERMALNAPIQGSAADIIKLAMLAVDAQLRVRGLSSRMLLQIHDELLFEIAPGEREVVEELVREQMSGAVQLTVPMNVSVGVGRSWQDAGH